LRLAHLPPPPAPAGVDDHLEEPGARRGLAAERRRPAPGGEEPVLERVLGLALAPAEAQGVAKERVLVALDQPLERTPVPCPAPGEELLVASLCGDVLHACHLPDRPWCESALTKKVLRSAAPRRGGRRGRRRGAAGARRGRPPPPAPPSSSARRRGPRAPARRTRSRASSAPARRAGRGPTRRPRRGAGSPPSPR